MTSDTGDLDSEHRGRKLKVEKIFQLFDRNADGRLNRDEMASLVIAVNPRVKFSPEQIDAILDEVFRTYGPYIDGVKGLSFEGLLRTYDDGAGDVDRDFDALRLDLMDTDEDGVEEGVDTGFGGDEEDEGDADPSMAAAGSSTPPGIVSITDERTKPVRYKDNVGAWASSPNDGIVYDETWKLAEDLEAYLRRVDNRIGGKKKDEETSKKDPANMEVGDWSKDLGSVGQEENKGGLTGRKPEDLGYDCGSFKKALADFRARADGLRSQGILQGFDAHMAVGRTLWDHRWYAEALTSFQKAIELKPDDARAHFRAGNALYSIGKVSEARQAYEKALVTAQSSGSHHSLRPQVHVNLGIALEGEGMLLGACDQYRQAGILNTSHFRAIKHLGSALLGVGEYRAAEKALNEAILLKDDYADAHCDLGSALAGLGENERATTQFRYAIDLQPDHVDALYNLGGLLRDAGKYSQAAEMYTKVLGIRPRDWRAQLNRAVALLGAGDSDAAKKAMREAYKTTNRVEVYDAMMHLKHMQKKPKGLASVINTQDGLIRDQNGGSGRSPDGYVPVELSKFHRATAKTSPRLWLGCALDIRRFQKHTRLHKLNDTGLRNEMNNNAKISGEVGASWHLVRKAELEQILRRLLSFLSPEAFQTSMKAINERLLAILDRGSTGKVDLGMFLASITPLCASLIPEKRKRLVFQILAWRNPVAEGEIAKADAKSYIKFMRAMYLPSQGSSDMWEVHGGDDKMNISYPEFVDMFDDLDWGFGILTLLAKLEMGDRLRHQGLPCAVCLYPIIGSRFKEVDANFYLCSTCYSEGKVPTSFKQDEYNFREYGWDTDSMRDKFKFLSLKNSPGSQKN